MNYNSETSFDSKATFNHDPYTVYLPKLDNTPLRFMKQDPSIEKVRMIDSLLYKVMKIRMNQLERGHYRDI